MADSAGPSIQIMPLPLGGEESTEPERMGRKAANLAVLLRAGFPVPEGWVLPVEAFGRVLESARASDMSPEDAISSGSLPADLLDAIERIAKAVASPVAVRSSALAEDLPGASYAGLYETILGVEQDQIEQAVRCCWASAFAARVSSHAGEDWSVRGNSPPSPLENRCGKPSRVVLDHPLPGLLHGASQLRRGPRER